MLNSFLHGLQGGWRGASESIWRAGLFFGGLSSIYYRMINLALYDDLDDFELCGRLARDVASGVLPFSYFKTDLDANEAENSMSTEEVRVCV